MQRFLILLYLALTPLLAQAWNGAGHRLVASIAWQQLSAPTRLTIADLLAQHPDYERWQKAAHASGPGEIFIEASTWPDDIRQDRRFYDEEREAATPGINGLPDSAMHKRWHYVDLGADGQRLAGELDSRIDRLSRELAHGGTRAKVYALPWLLHLVADIHQPLHVGNGEDEGGNLVEIENPFNPRQAVSSLHRYWDDLPGPPWLRGKRLEKVATFLLERYPPPERGSITRWRDESRRLRAMAYPEADASQRPIINEQFNQRARDIANQRIVAAGYRLGWLLEELLGSGVSRPSRTRWQALASAG